jgi:hypothetical protein
MKPKSVKIRRSVVKQMYQLIFLVLLLLSINTSYSIAQVSHTTDVYMNIAEVIEVLQWPTEIYTLSDGAIPGVPIVSQILTIKVRSNTIWGITIASDQDNGFLREYDNTGAFYIGDGKTTTSPLEWSVSPVGPWLSLSSTPTALITGEGPTGDTGKEISFYFRFTPSFDDEKLSGESRTYKVSITYTVGVGY